MQTFVPHREHAESARVLDNKRLNKQLLEGRQIIGILATGKTKGAWVNHPAVLMWRGCEGELYRYLEDIKNECVDRGISTEKNWSTINQIKEDAVVWTEYRMPDWWTDTRVFQSHRMNLYRKDPEYYAQYGGAYQQPCCTRCQYFWPVSTHGYEVRIAA